MNARSRLLLFTGLFLLCAGVLLFMVSGKDALAGSDSGSSLELARRPAASGSITDEPLAGYRVQLLDLAFETASKMPAFPHIKNRSRAQEEVVETCLELEQPLRALAYVARIDNWRRGSGYADLAFYAAQHGDGVRMQECMEHALEVADAEDAAAADEAADEEEEGDQEWRRDRIRVKVARTHAWLGDADQAAQLETGVVPSETGRVEAVKAMLVGEDAFDDQLDALDQLILAGSLDQARNALDGCVHLYERFYADEELRSRAEERIKSSTTKLPTVIRVEALMDLIEIMLDHENRDRALALVNETHLLLAATCQHIPYVSRLAGLRFRAGDEERARKDADAALALFDEKRAEVQDFERGEILRPLAEAYREMGDEKAALATYRRAIEDGAENPNARPRAEDLVATCRSMALHAIEPDADLWARLFQIHDGLSDPW